MQGWSHLLSTHRVALCAFHRACMYPLVSSSQHGSWVRRESSGIFTWRTSKLRPREGTCPESLSRLWGVWTEPLLSPVAQPCGEEAEALSSLLRCWLAPAFPSLALTPGVMCCPLQALSWLCHCDRPGECLCCWGKNWGRTPPRPQRIEERLCGSIISLFWSPHGILWLYESEFFGCEWHKPSLINLTKNKCIWMIGSSLRIRGKAGEPVFREGRFRIALGEEAASLPRALLCRQMSSKKDNTLCLVMMSTGSAVRLDPPLTSSVYLGMSLCFLISKMGEITVSTS